MTTWTRRDSLPSPSSWSKREWITNDEGLLITNITLLAIATNEWEALLVHTWNFVEQDTIWSRRPRIN